MKANETIVPRRLAFTLVELLVVIGIIAVLIALLLPALSRARQNAQKLKCAANLQTLGQLLVLRANDHHGYFPLAGNIFPGSDGTEADDPQTLGDTTKQRYDYYDNSGIGDLRVTALPASLAPYIINSPASADSWENVDADIQARGPLQDAFLCPSDESTIQRTYSAPQWIKNLATNTYLSGWSSYGFNGEIFGWTDNGDNGTTGHSRARGQLSSIPNAAQTMLMCDTNPNTPNGNIEVWVLGGNLSLGDVYLGTGGTVGSGIFDLSRHRGTMNILYVDGHVDSKIILSNGATSATGAIGTNGNSPSGDLMSVSMNKDFR